MRTKARERSGLPYQPSLNSRKRNRSARGAVGALGKRLLRAFQSPAAGPVLGLAMAAAIPPAFDSDRAMELLVKQVSFGARVPGSEAHAQTLDWLIRTLKGKAERVSKQPFTLHSALTGDTVLCHNVVASFRPELEERIFFGAHWDSRALADMNPEPGGRSMPVPGANDGASGVAILLVLAESFVKQPPPLGVDLIFFDGEDQGVSGEHTTFCKGSQAFAARMSVTGFRPAYGVVIDLAAGKQVRYHPEVASMRNAPELMERILVLGERHLPGWVDRSRPIEIYDDHIPFIEAGIDCALLFGYGDPNWHTVSDTPRNCSRKKLGGVGKLLLELIYAEEE